MKGIKLGHTSYTASHFHHCGLQARARRYISAGVDWVWVDVACIDQDDVRSRAEEVGRQAGIFRVASSAFIWLHQTPSEKLQQFANGLFHLSEKFGEDQEYLMILLPSCVWNGKWMHNVSETLTLVEDCRRLQRQGYKSVGLASFLVAWGQIELALRRAIKFTATLGYESLELRREATDPLSRMDRLGLSAHDNPVTLYSAARSRKATS